MYQPRAVFSMSAHRDPPALLQKHGAGERGEDTFSCSETVQPPFLSILTLEMLIGMQKQWIL